MPLRSRFIQNHSSNQDLFSLKPSFPTKPSFFPLNHLFSPSPRPLRALLSSFSLLRRRKFSHSQAFKLSSSPQGCRTAKNWGVRIGPLAHPFVRTAHSFARSALLISLLCFAELICSLSHSLIHSRARGQVND